MARVSNPDSRVATSTVSGSAFPVEGTAPKSVAARVVAADWQYGALVDAPKKPRFGWRPMAQVGTSAVWRAIASSDPNKGLLDTMRFQIDENDVYVPVENEEPPSNPITAERRTESLFDPWWDIRVRFKLDDGSYVYSDYFRVISANRSPRRMGVEPSFKEAHRFAADYTSHKNYVQKLLALGDFPAHPEGQSGLLFGGEPSAMGIIRDPVPDGQGGHRNHGNVVEVRPPMDYAERTAGVQGSFGRGKYSNVEGNQPTGSKNNTLRWQFVFPARLDEGDEVWDGFALYLPAGFPRTRFHLSLWQDYQEDYRWGLGPMGETKSVDKNHVENPPGRIRVHGERFAPNERSVLFDMPFYEEQWVDVVRRRVASRSGLTGGYEYWTRQPGVAGNKLVQHVWPDGSTFLRMPTLQETPPAGGGKLQVHHHLYFNISNFPDSIDTPDVPARMLIAGQKMGGSRDEVDPKSYY